jgi:hypothetical protein
METPDLITQDQGDLNTEIGERIRLINEVFKGGLGEFFDNLRRENQDYEPPTSEIERLIESNLSEAAKCEDSPPRRGNT